MKTIEEFCDKHKIKTGKDVDTSPYWSSMKEMAYGNVAWFDSGKQLRFPIGCSPDSKEDSVAMLLWGTESELWDEFKSIFGDFGLTEPPKK